MSHAVILKSLRTPIGKFQGALSALSAPDLGAAVVKALLAQVPGIQPTEAIFGNVVGAGIGQAPARIAALRGGLPPTSSALTINQVCGSGLKAVQLAAAGVLMGDHEVILAGGMESMTNAPYLLPKLRAGARMGHAQALDSMIQDGLWCAHTDQHMGNTGELVADKYAVGRQAQDQWAAESHAKALKAIQEGALGPSHPLLVATLERLAKRETGAAHMTGCFRPHAGRTRVIFIAQDQRTLAVAFAAQQLAGLQDSGL